MKDTAECYHTKNNLCHVDDNEDDASVGLHSRRLRKQRGKCVEDKIVYQSKWTEILLLVKKKN